MKVSVIQFPDSNCDHDAYEWARTLAGLETDFVWYAGSELGGPDLVILPGGFSYGDYLRPGAMAARAPVMKAVVEHARAGGLVIGICNGFQVLCEVGLLPGALLRNVGLTFLCMDVHLRCETSDSPFTCSIGVGDLLKVPIAHGDGNYFADGQTLEQIEKEGRVAFRYAGPEGQAGQEWNPNGSQNSIAGILSENRRVLGMMPHPERASEGLLGSEDGLRIIRSAIKFLEGAK